MLRVFRRIQQLQLHFTSPGNISPLPTMPNRYTDVHKDPKGEGDARPTGIQIVDDEGLAGKLSDKIFLVTGVTSGIGVDTVDALAHTGATVYAAARDLGRAEKALAHIKQPGKIELLELDLGSLDSVRKGAADFVKRSGNRLNVLVCNAGIMAVPKVEHTKDGFESQFGTNHLGHFLLFQLVKDALLASASADFSSRVVVLSSSGHRANPPRVKNGDYNFTEEGSYSPWGGYGQAKTANIWMANQIDRLYGSKHLHATSVMPGGIWTPLQKHLPEELMGQWKSAEPMKKFMKNTAQGSATSVWAAVGKEWESKGGKYLEDCDEAKLDEGENAMAGYKPHAYDEAGEKKLWEDSLKLVGVSA